MFFAFLLFVSRMLRCFLTFFYHLFHIHISARCIGRPIFVTAVPVAPYFSWLICLTFVWFVCQQQFALSMFLCLLVYCWHNGHYVGNIVLVGKRSQALHCTKVNRKTIVVWHTGPSARSWRRTFCFNVFPCQCVFVPLTIACSLARGFDLIF